MLCNQCNHEIQEGSLFCVYCGAKIEASAYTPKKKRIISIIAVFLVIVACILLTSVFIAMGGSEKKLQKQLDLGAKYLEEMDYENAILAYEAAIEIDERSVDAYLGLAEVYIEIGDLEKAIKVLSEGYDKIESEDINKELERLKEREVAKASKEHSTSAGKEKGWLRNFITGEQEKEERVDDIASPDINEEVAVITEEAPIDEHIENREPEWSAIEYNSHISLYRRHRLSDYSFTSPDYNGLLWFTFDYMKNRAQEKVFEENGYDVISKESIDEFTDYHFDITVPAQNIGDFTYRNGKFYCMSADSGDIGMPLLITDEISRDGNGNCSITFYEVYVNFYDDRSGENNSTDPLDYYGSTIENIRADRFCEITGQGSCVIKWMGDRYVLLEYEIHEKELQTEEDYIQYLYSNVYELGTYDYYIRENSGGNAELIITRDWENQTNADKAGNPHVCDIFYVGEMWIDGHSSRWDYFAVDKNTKQIYWWEMESEVLYELDEWRQSSHYRSYLSW